MINALTTVIVGVGICAFLIRQLIGWAGLTAILVVLACLAAASIAVSRDTIQRRGVLPTSLLAFLTWTAISFFWSQYRWESLAGFAYLACFSLLGIYIALLRDTIQLVRTFGDVLRFVLALSLGFEILSGVLLDAPIAFLGITGGLGTLGPIQGITGTRNQLGIIAVIAIITFAIEFRTHLVARGLSISSLVGGGLVLMLTRSPLAIGALLVVFVAGAALYGLRRVAPGHKRFWQLGILTSSIAGLAVSWAARAPIVAIFNAGGDLAYRLGIWRGVVELLGFNPLLGWGWIGTWHLDIAPFHGFKDLGVRSAQSASNAFLDVWLQLGLVGLVIFLGMAGLALVRSWLLASRRRSVAYAWPALVLVAIIVTSMGESSILGEFGWLCFVACCIKAAREVTWRRAFDETDD